MTVFIVVSIIVVIGLAVAATLGRLGHSDLQLHPPVSTAGGWAPSEDGLLTSDDIDDIRFDTAVRGYRMDQVDAMLARVRASLAASESEMRHGFSDYPGGSEWTADSSVAEEEQRFGSAGDPEALARDSRQFPRQVRRDGPTSREKE